MRHIWVRSLWIAALLGALGTSPASGSCIVPVLADQIARADVIAYGSVASAAQLLSFPPRSVLRFRIERLYKGEASGEVQVAAGPSEGAATSVDYHAEDGTKHTLGRVQRKPRRSALGRRDEGAWRRPRCRARRGHRSGPGRGGSRRAVARRRRRLRRGRLATSLDPAAALARWQQDAGPARSGVEREEGGGCLRLFVRRALAVDEARR